VLLCCARDHGNFVWRLYALVGFGQLPSMRIGATRLLRVEDVWKLAAQGGKVTAQCESHDAESPKSSTHRENPRTDFVLNCAYGWLKYRFYRFYEIMKSVTYAPSISITGSIPTRASKFKPA